MLFATVSCPTVKMQKGLFSWATNWYLEHRPQLLMAANLYASIEFDETLF